MGATTGIEWTDATWNPVTGCTKVSPGCDRCYAKTMHERFNGKGSFDTVTLHPERLDLPLRWRKPRRVFVNSMSDLFHDDVPDEYVARVFAVMALAPKHTFQVLTKRHGRMRSLLSNDDFARAVGREWLWHPKRVTYTKYPGWPLPNVWLGVSVENQQWADIRIPALLDTPAAVRFLSCEPLLGPVDLRAHFAGCCPEHDFPGGFCVQRDHAGVQHIGWCIVGGESGPGARRMHAQWVRDIRDQCQAAGVPFLFKQWGAWAPTRRLGVGALDDPRTCYGETVDDGKHTDLTWRRIYQRIGKKAAGRELDGRTWDQYPVAIEGASK